MAQLNIYRNKTQYVYPKLGGRDLIFIRIFGPGLGNMLFPWARAYIYAKKNGLKMIWPSWTQFKIGPFLRQENDKRNYSGLFIPNECYIGGIKKLFLLAIKNKSTEKKINGRKEEIPYSRNIIYFSGMENYFSTILDDHHIIFEALQSITRSEHKKGLYYDFGVSISVHIRLGDFAITSNSNTLERGLLNQRIPLEWYISIIDKIRIAANKKLKVFIFSDGSDDDLKQILNLDNVIRVSFGSSISDLFGLAKSCILVASGSTFSMWASYLGRMPVIWHPGQLRQKIYNNNEIEIECGIDQGLNEVIKNKIINLSKNYD